jgi:hypothetical protein
LLIFDAFGLAQLFKASVSKIGIFIPKIMIFLHFLGRTMHVEYTGSEEDERSYGLYLGAQLIP